MRDRARPSTAGREGRRRGTASVPCGILPAGGREARRGTAASDAVILHLWQAVQIALDLAVAACARLNLGTPAGFADAFRRLESARVLSSALAERLVKAAGFRNVVAHADEGPDMVAVHHAAASGPADLRAFLAALRHRLPPG